MAIPAAKIIEQRTHIIPGKLKVTEHIFQTLRDYSNPDAGTLRLFARSAQRHNVPLNRAEAEEDATKNGKSPTSKRPNWMVYFQGGPGGACPRPQDAPWASFLLDKEYTVLMLDQRGTGMSSAVTGSTLRMQGDEDAQVDYLKLFRADNIIRDAEAVRKALMAADAPSGTASTTENHSEAAASKTNGTSTNIEHDDTWSIIGQSFGGFCCTAYLSMYPESLREAFLLGGLPPMIAQSDNLYERLFDKVRQRNRAFYAKYPEDVSRVKTLVRFLQKNRIILPSGSPLTPRRFLAMGLSFGAHGGLDEVHDVILRATIDLDTVKHLTLKSLAQIERMNPFDEAIIYALLHEAIYCQGHASDWSAERALAKQKDFNIDTSLASSTDPVLFTGEMVLHSTFTDSTELGPLYGVAEKLAKVSDWPQLYDRERLAANTVPVYSATYMDDMYVDFPSALETAATIKGCRLWVSSVIYHDGIRARAEEVMRALWALREDTID